MLTLSDSPKTLFNTVYDGYPAIVFLNTSEYNNFTLRLRRHGLSYLTKIIKGKRAGKKRREFIVMLVEEAEKQDGDRD